MRYRVLLTATLSAAAASSMAPVASAQDAEPREARYMGGGADPRAPGPLTVVARPTHGPAFNPSAGPTGWSFDFHGYLNAPFLASLSSHDQSQQGHRNLLLHSPAVVPDTQWANWLNTNTHPLPWGALMFSYGTPSVIANVGINAFNFNPATQTPVGFTGPTGAPNSYALNDNARISLGPAFLTFLAPSLAGGRGRLDWNVGIFTARYGAAGRYDYGRLGTYLIGAISAPGEVLGGEYDFGKLTLRVEHGLAAQQFDDSRYVLGTTLVHHAHVFLGGYDQLFRVGAHYIDAFAPDDRVTTSNGRTGHETVFGLDGFVDPRGFGRLYAGVSHIRAKDSNSVGPALYVVNAGGGPGLQDNYLGLRSGGNGTVTTALVQYDLSLGALLRRPKPFNGDAADVTLSLFGMETWIGSDDPRWHRARKLKLGAVAEYTPLPWLGVGARIDHLTPDTVDAEQSFSILSPRLIFRSAFLTHEQLEVQYSKYFYGNKRPITPNPLLSGPRNPGASDQQLGLDSDMLMIAARAWW